MKEKTSTKDKIPFYVFNKQIAYSPRKKGEKVVFKESFKFEGSVYLKSMDFAKKIMEVTAPTAYMTNQILYIEGDEIFIALSKCILVNGKMFGEWQVYRAGRKILLRSVSDTSE